MAVTPLITNVRIEPPDPGGDGIWRVALGILPRRSFESVLAICDSEPEARAFIAALELDGLLGRIGERLTQLRSA